MPFKFAVLWEMAGQESQPVGLAVERDNAVIVELPNGYGFPKRYSEPYRVLGPDLTETVYQPGGSGYFEQVLIDLTRHFAVVEQSTVDSPDETTIYKLLQEYVLAPRTQRRRADYLAGIMTARNAPGHRPLLQRRPEAKPTLPCGDENVRESQQLALVA